MYAWVWFARLYLHDTSFRCCRPGQSERERARTLGAHSALAGRARGVDLAVPMATGPATLRRLDWATSSEQGNPLPFLCRELPVSLAQTDGGVGQRSEGRGLPSLKVEFFGRAEICLVRPGSVSSTVSEQVRVSPARRGGCGGDAGSRGEGLGTVRADRGLRGKPEARRRAAQLGGHGPGDPRIVAPDHHGTPLEQCG